MILPVTASETIDLDLILADASGDSSPTTDIINVYMGDDGETLIIEVEVEQTTNDVYHSLYLQFDTDKNASTPLSYYYNGAEYYTHFNFMLGTFRVMDRSFGDPNNGESIFESTYTTDGNKYVLEIPLEVLGYPKSLDFSVEMASTISGDYAPDSGSIPYNCNPAPLDWPRFQKTNYNNGVTDNKAPITNPIGNSFSWESHFSSGDWFDSSTLVLGSTVYVVGNDGVVRAINKTSGDELWATQISVFNSIVGSMAYGDGKLYVPTDDGQIFAIDIVTGNEVWNATLPASPFSKLNTPIIYEENRIYFGEYMGDESYYCYDTDIGNQIWMRSSNSGEGYYWAGAALIGDYLIYGDDGSHLVSVSKIDGTTIDEIDVSTVFSVTTNQIRSSVSYVEETNKLYFTSQGGYCYSLGFDPITGAFNTSNKVSHFIGLSTSTPTIYDGKLYVGTGNVLSASTQKIFYCLDAVTLNENWNFVANGPIESSPVVSTAHDDGNGEVYVYFTTNAATGNVYCLNETGAVQWSWGDSSKTAYTLCGISISEGWMFFGTDSKYLFGFANEESLDLNPIANFMANETFGYAPMIVQFTDQSSYANSWSWDLDGDGNEDSTEQNPQFSYTSPGAYGVTLTVSNSAGTDIETKMDYIYIADDWNPWNDPDSDSGEMITFAEVMEAYNSFISQSGAPGTGEDIDFATVMVMYNAFVSQTPM
ncbi:PQQ-binding-like beta-propeller repeat protein [Methanolobus sp. ZRKC2]|uniref:outer membrane protein assembly factor BamB family protein n=1 Tax=Methanolobus sp. ZRKC2 TaxID=3125783 RepID=UPI00324D2DE9